MMGSLRGLRILNTRPQEQAQYLSQNIREAGGTVIELPTIQIDASSDNWIHSITNLTKVDQAIFISANAVKFCFLQLKHQGIKWPDTIQVIAIGKGTADSLRKFGIKVSAIPQQADSEHLLALESLQQVKQQNMLLFKGYEGRPLIEEQLLKKGANLKVVPVYQRVIPKISQEFIQSIWRDDLVDIILLTSELSLHNLFKRNTKVCFPHKVMDTLFEYIKKD
jgi:uroporphyrinogen-III synthase